MAERKEERFSKKVWEGLGDVGVLLLFLVAMYLMSRSCGAG